MSLRIDALERQGLVGRTEDENDRRSVFVTLTAGGSDLLERVIPVALKTAKPGTPEFREAIRQALLSEREIAASQGVYNFTEKDRYGLDDRSRIILTVKDGKYVLAK